MLTNRIPRARRFRAELRAARRRLAGLHPREVTTPSGVVRYAEAGDGPPVLVVHGIFGGYDAGLHFTRQNVPDGFRGVAPARFGYLGSTLPPRPSPASQADAFAALLDALHIDRVAVVGLSAGSPSTLQFAIRHPDRVRAMILCSAAVPGPHYDRAPLPRPLARVLRGSDALMWAVCRCAPRPIRELMDVPCGLVLSAADEAAVAEQLELVLPVRERIAGVLFDAFESNRALNRGYPLASITAPTLVVHAQDDPGPPYPAACAMAARIPGARLVTVEHGGHLMLGEHPEVPREIAGLLRRTADPTSSRSVSR